MSDEGNQVLLLTDLQRMAVDGSHPECCAVLECLAPYLSQNLDRLAACLVVIVYSLSKYSLHTEPM